MASIPVYLLSISGKITILYVTYKAIQKLTREYWYSSSEIVDTGGPGVPEASVVPAVFPACFSSAVEAREIKVEVKDFNKDRSNEENGIKEKENKKSESPESSQEKAEVSPPLEFNFLDLPMRPGERECSDYMHDGNCKDGRSCRFHHPNPVAVGGDILSGSVELHLPDASQVASTSGSSLQNETVPDQDATNPQIPLLMLPRQGMLASNGDQVNEESEKGDLSEKKGQEECKYHLQPGGCKFRKACRISHSQGKPTLPPSPPTQPLDFNFLDLPIRPGERECSYYMRNGFCKYGRNCRFHHPDPVAVEEGHIPPASFLFSPSGVLEPTSASLSSPSNGDVPYLGAANPFVPSMVLPHQWVPDPEWNEYQATSSHEWTQPLLVPNPGHAGWSRPKTPPAMDGNCRKDAKKTKILQPPYCHICKIHCSSKDNLVQHKLGKKHKEKEALKKSKKETSAPAASVAPVVKDSMIGPRESPDISESKTVRQSAECEIHNIDCRSKDVSDQHKMEKKHQNNLEKVEQSKKEAEVVQSMCCDICKVQCTSEDILAQHKLGKKHKKKMDALEKLKKEASAPAASAVPMVKDPMIGPKESPEIEEGMTVTKSAECEVPNIDARSKNVLDQHELENKHQNNLEKVEQSKKEAEVVQSLCCEICKVHCTSEDILAQHKLGRKHKKKMDALEKSKKETSAPAASAAPMVKDPMIGPKERPKIDEGMTITKSVECEVPNVDARSKNVLEQHKWEKKHQNNLEKVEQSKNEANAPAAKDPVIDPNPERNCYQATFQYKGRQLLLVANPKHPVNGTCSNKKNEKKPYPQILQRLQQIMMAKLETA